MKIKMDKEVTPVSKAKIVKEAMKNFKQYYTDSDILYMLIQSVEDGYQLDGKIYDCEVEAFPQTSFSWDNDVCFRIEMVTGGSISGFKVISAVVNEGLALVDGSHIIVEKYGACEYVHLFSKN